MATAAELGTWSGERDTLRYDGHSELLKAAPKRLSDALELLEEPTREPEGSDAGYRHLCGAYYLAGYAVECALKAYVILLLDARRPGQVATWSEAIRALQGAAPRVNVSGARGHSLKELLKASGLESQMDQDPAMQQNWGICSKWDYNERYRPTFMTDRDAVAEFVDACVATYSWLKARLPFC